MCMLIGCTCVYSVVIFLYATSPCMCMPICHIAYMPRLCMPICHIAYMPHIYPTHYLPHIYATQSNSNASKLECIGGGSMGGASIGRGSTGRGSTPVPTTNHQCTPTSTTPPMCQPTSTSAHMYQAPLHAYDGGGSKGYDNVRCHSKKEH